MLVAVAASLEAGCVDLGFRIDGRMIRHSARNVGALGRQLTETRVLPSMHPSDAQRNRRGNSVAGQSPHSMSAVVVRLIVGLICCRYRRHRHYLVHAAHSPGAGRRAIQSDACPDAGSANIRGCAAGRLAQSPLFRTRYATTLNRRRRQRYGASHRAGIGNTVIVVCSRMIVCERRRKTHPDVNGRSAIVVVHFFILPPRHFFGYEVVGASSITAALQQWTGRRSP